MTGVQTCALPIYGNCQELSVQNELNSQGVFVERMCCKEYQHQITLLLYEELPEATRAALETHIHACPHCNDAYESEKSMHSVLADDAARWEMPSDLLVELRKTLADELDCIREKAILVANAALRKKLRLESERS